MQGWSKQENVAIVESYFEMLSLELRGQPYNKTFFRKQLSPLLSNRSDGSIERKHQNISAVLNELGLQSIIGYKPLPNYQRGIFPDVILDYLVKHPPFEKQLSEDVDVVPALVIPTVNEILKSLVDCPERKAAYATKVRENTSRVTAPKNYLALEAANHALGSAGENFVLNYEKARLIASGKDNLADKIEHVSQTQGDGAGFDILSFETDGRERFIEAKTTKQGKYTPFFISQNEINFSQSNQANYNLYRVFEFRNEPKLFILRGDVSQNCLLSPQNYRASFNLS